MITFKKFTKEDIIDLLWVLSPYALSITLVAFISIYSFIEINKVYNTKCFINNTLLFEGTTKGYISEVNKIKYLYSVEGEEIKLEGQCFQQLIK